MNILCCIPARYNSTRLPGKPLLKIQNKTVIQRVYEQALKTSVKDIVILTDDKRICEEVISFGGKCEIITDECLNGTDRIIKYLKTIDYQEYDAVLNIQGDEPFIDSSVVDKVIDNFIVNKPECSTVCFKTKDKEEINSKSRGKTVVNKNNDIIYCSRNIIPSNKKREISDIEYNIHVGVFVFDANYLMNEYTKENTPLQLEEDIEWLKIIEQGYRVNTILSNKLERGIDTQEDYEYLLNKYDT